MREVLSEYGEVSLGQTPEYQPSNTALLYLVSSKKGLGHVSRAVAIAGELSPELSVQFGMYPQLEPYVMANLTDRDRFNIMPVSYTDSPRTMDFAGYEEHKRQFLSDNPDVIRALENGNPIVTDFFASTLFLRDLITERNLDNLLVGVYHSIDSSYSPDDEIRHWQERNQQVVNALDILFLTELQSQHREPYLNQKGTLIIPVGPIVRPITQDPSEVKEALSLKEKEEFIIVQAGMRENDGLVEQVLEVRNSLDDNTKIVLMYWNQQLAESLGEIEGVILAPQMGGGQNIIAAAQGVIARPGMQTLAEAVSYRTPIIFLPDGHPERRIKVSMLQELLGDSSIPTLLDDGSFAPKIQEWVKARELIQARFAQVEPDGAQQVALYLQRMLSEGILQESTRSLPAARTKVPPGKKEGHLSLGESRRRIAEMGEFIQRVLLDRIVQCAIPASVIAFGGVGKGVLREDSDLDLLIVLESDDLKEVDTLFASMNTKISEERLVALGEGVFDALRFRAQMPDGTDVNSSLMMSHTYRRIFSPFTQFFKEELGERISQLPYHVSDFMGRDYPLPKVYEVETPSGLERQRLSPGIIDVDGMKLIGVKERMLLTSEVWHDGLSLGDPAKKLLRGVSRAICYWNNLYERDETGKAVGIKRHAFDANYLFRILRDPWYMFSPEKTTELKGLYYNELRRIDYMLRSR